MVYSHSSSCNIERFQVPIRPSNFIVQDLIKIFPILLPFPKNPKSRSVNLNGASEDNKKKQISNLNWGFSQKTIYGFLAYLKYQSKTRSILLCVVDSGERRRNYPQKMTLSNNCCSTTFSPQRSVLLSFLIYKSQELQKENRKTYTEIQTYTTALMTATAEKTKHIQKRSECQSQRCQLNYFSVTCGDFSTYEVS